MRLPVFVTTSVTLAILVLAPGWGIARDPDILAQREGWHHGFRPWPRAVGMGGATVATARGAGGVYVNPAALPGPAMFDMQAGAFGGPDGYLEADEILHWGLVIGAEHLQFQFSTLAEIHGYDDPPEDVRDHDAPERAVYKFGVGFDLLRSDHGPWRLRSGVSAVVNSMINQSEYVREDLDFDVGLTLAHEPTRQSGWQLGWQSAVAWTSLKDCFRGTRDHDLSDLTLAAALELALHDPDPDPVAMSNGRPVFRQAHDRRRRVMDMVLAVERTEYLNSGYAAEHRVGCEVGLGGVAFLRVGWRDASRSFEQGWSQGLGLEVAVAKAHRVRLDWGRTGTVDNRLVSGDGNVVSIRWHAGLVR